MLDVQDLKSGYGETTVLHGLSAKFHQGHIHAVLGRNGVGKTTLLRTIVGQCAVSQGTIRIMEHDISAMPTPQRARLGIGYVPETRDIFASLTVKENLLLAARLGNVHIDAAIEHMLGIFPNLRPRLRNSGKALSGGEQQMLAIARALISDARIILLDEPSEGLAPNFARDIFAQLSRLKAQGLTIVLVEQNHSLALEIADDVSIMDRGRMVWHSTADEIREKPEQFHKLLGI